MEFSGPQLAWQALVAGGLLALALALVAVRGAPWHRLRAPEMQHAVGAGCVALMLLWSIRAGFAPVLGYHFFGVTTLTLMFGWQLAYLAAIPVLVAGCFLGHGDWAALGVNALALFALPAGVTWGLLAFARRRLPHNFFVFIYVNAYLGAACAMAAVTVAMSAVLLLSGNLEPGAFVRDYVVFLPLLALAEGFINGMTMTVLVATRPGLVWTFDDATYLRG